MVKAYLVIVNPLIQSESISFLFIAVFILLIEEYGSKELFLVIFQMYLRNVFTIQSYFNLYMDDNV